MTEPLREERLAEIRARMEHRRRVHEAVQEPEGSSWSRMRADCEALLAEVERLRAELAVVRPIVEAVAALEQNGNDLCDCWFHEGVPLAQQHHEDWIREGRPHRNGCPYALARHLRQNAPPAPRP